MLKIGDVITLELQESESHEKYRCKLVERENDILYIDYPINVESRKTAFILDGTRLNCTFVSQGGSPYKFSSVILKRMKRKIPMLVLSYPGDTSLIRLQRRQYVRVKVSLDVTIHSVDNDFEPITIVSDDFSAGGVSIIVPKNIPLQKNLVIKCCLVLPINNDGMIQLELLSRIVRMNAVNEYENRIALEFCQVEPDDRQLMIRYSFEQQLLQRKKELK